MGGLATVTVLTAVGLAGSATAAFGALRALGAATGPAALGGAAFGFSPAIVAQSLGHPKLVFDVLAPVLVLLAVRLAVEERPLRTPTTLVRSAFAQDVARWRACAAVLGPSPHADAMRAQVTALVGREPEAVGGVLLWRGL